MQKIKLCRNLKIKWEILKDGSAVTLDGLNLTLILVNYFGTREMAFSTDNSNVVCVIKDSEQLNPGEYWFALYQNYRTDNQSLVSVCDHFELVADSHCCDSSEVTIGGDSSCDCGPNLELGVQGDSAYAIWLKNGHEGSEEDFITWLQEPSNDAAEKADTATQNAIQATANAKSATELANVAASKATASASTADSAAQSATASAEQAQTAIEDANNAASNANKMADYANESASNANTATQEAKNATAQAIASAKSADESAAYAKEQGDYAKGFIGKVNDIEASLSSVQELIPNTATSENQLADKEFVNSSITTNTATFKGTFETSDDLPTTDVKANDYAFVIATDSTGNPEYQRYKYSNNAWAFEYTLNNSSFTAEQWAAITSGITSTKITSLEDADKSLTDKINAEASTRETADTAITSRVEKLEAIPIAKGTGVGSVLVNSVDSNQSGGKYSFSVGEYSNASAECSSAIGSYCGAYGKFSFCAGQGCATLGTYGIALGNHTTSGYSVGAVALCNYNEDDTGLIHSVGIGRGDSARKNAEAIYTDGKKYVYGVGNYDGTKASIEKGALDIATYEQKLLTVVTNTSSSVAGCVRLKTTDAQHISGNMLFCDDGLKAKFANFGILTDGSSSLSIRTNGIVTQNNLLYIKDIGNYNESIDDEGVEDVATVINNIQSSVTDEVTRATAAEKVNSDAIDLLNDEETVEGSVKYIAKQYADKVKTILINVSFDGWTCDYTFDEIKALINGSDDIPTFVLRGLSSALSTAPSVVYSTSAKIYSTYLCIEVYTTSDNNPYRAVVYLPSTNGRPAITSDDSFRLASSNEVEDSITSHNIDADSHSDIRTLISNETSARQSADTTLEAKIPTTTEDFVFTLEDGTEVTKSIYVK